MNRFFSLQLVLARFFLLAADDVGPRGFVLGGLSVSLAGVQLRSVSLIGGSSSIVDKL